MTKTKKSRRDFLKAAGVAGGAAGVAAVALAKTTEAAVPESRKSSGYQETDHVKKYYELARF